MSDKIRELNENEIEAVVGGTGTRQVRVPDVVGLPVMEAKMQLDMDRFVAKVSQTGSQSGEAIVTRQSPAAGTYADERAYILLYTE